MNIQVIRKIFTDQSTISDLLVDGIKMGVTLEDVDRGLTQEMSLDEIKKIKVFAETAIPYGVYEVILDYSDHFGRILPHILNVKGFDGVRMHKGNDAPETEGCVLVGTTATK